MMFELNAVLKEGADAIRKNYALAIPGVIAALLKVSLGSFFVFSEEAVAEMLALGFVGMVVDYFAHGVTLAMAKEAIEKGETSLNAGIGYVAASPFRLMAVSFTLSAIIGAGFMLILPGLVAVFFLMFAFPYVIMQGVGAVEGIKRSYSLVRANINDSLLLFVVLAAILVAVTFVSLMFASVQMVGQYISVILNGIAGGFSAVVLIRAHIIFEARGAAETN